MKQFIYGSDAAFAALELRARGACVRFKDQEMPIGTTPSRAAVGFEIDPDSGEAKLLVEHGLVYLGTSSEISAWLATGEKRFADFSALRVWVLGHLRSFFEPHGPALVPADAQAAEIASVGTATDEQGKPLDLDQEEMEALRWTLLTKDPSRDLPS